MEAIITFTPNKGYNSLDLVSFFTIEGLLKGIELGAHKRLEIFRDKLCVKYKKINQIDTHYETYFPTVFEHKDKSWYAKLEGVSGILELMMEEN